MCCLVKQRGTGYAGDFTVKDTKATVNMISNTFCPTIKAEQYYYMIACDREKKLLVYLYWLLVMQILQSTV